MKEKWKTPAGTATAAALICGFVTHMYALVNTMHNYDDIAVQPNGVGGAMRLGRWLLEGLGALWRYLGWNFNLTWLNGVLFLLLLAASAGVLCLALQIRNRYLAALMGMLFVVFPTAVSSLVFRYTSIPYGIGIGLAVGACWALPRRRGLLLSAGLICLSLGVYQAYLPMTVGIFVLSILRRNLMGEADPVTLIREGLKACAAIVLGVAAYYVIMRLSVRVSGIELASYQGVSSMGSAGLRRMPQLIARAFTQCLTFAADNYCNLADSRMIRLAYGVLTALSAVMTGVLLIRGGKRPLSWALTAFLILVFPVAVNFIVVMSPDAHIYTLMQYAFVLVGCVPLVLLDCLLQTPAARVKGRLVMKRCVCLFTGILIFGYLYSANVNHMATYYYTRQTENYLTSVLTRVQMTQGYTPDKKWMVIGTLNDPMLDGTWSGVRPDGGIAKANGLVSAYSWTGWLDLYMGYCVPGQSDEIAWALAQTDEVKAMPCWPSEGSIRVIGDTVVIKCQNLE